MCHTCRKLSYGFKLMRLKQLCFKNFLFGNIFPQNHKTFKNSTTTL